MKIPIQATSPQVVGRGSIVLLSVLQTRKQRYLTARMIDDKIAFAEPSRADKSAWRPGWTGVTFWSRWSCWTSGTLRTSIALWSRWAWLTRRSSWPGRYIDRDGFRRRLRIGREHLRRQESRGASKR